jgi:hypothetical protein
MASAVSWVFMDDTGDFVEQFGGFGLYGLEGQGDSKSGFVLHEVDGDQGEFVWEF